MNYILSLDQGTTSSRAILFDEQGRIIEKSQREFKQIFPKSGWVEHDPMEILKTQLDTAQETIKKSGINIQDLSCIGITNQRETIIVWDIETGIPIYNAIVWQDRRTSTLCHNLKNEGKDNLIRNKTGLVIDAYFSATKIQWILDNIDGVRKKAYSGNLVFGTIDSWLIYHLTQEQLHVTDYSNASRTMLFNIHEKVWDEELFEIMNIPQSMAPKVVDSSGIIGHSKAALFGKSVPISGIVGDQQSALFGQACFDLGMAKNTYGTGCFMLLNTGEKAINTNSGLLTTIAWGINGEVEYALEGSVFNAGSTIQWLRDGLGIIGQSSDSERLANEVGHNEGVYMVPAFTGMGAPYWKMDARAMICGLSRGSSKGHIARAALEAIAYQTRDIFELMIKESNIDLKLMRVDGGASQNKFLMQFQSDILNVPIQLPQTHETTALGAAYLAGIAVGLFTREDISKMWIEKSEFSPSMKKNERETLYNGWLSAVQSCLSYK